jgi:hypothetical protein
MVYDSDDRIADNRPLYAPSTIIKPELSAVSIVAVHMQDAFWREDIAAPSSIFKVNSSDSRKTVGNQINPNKPTRLNRILYDCLPHARAL